MRKLLKRFTAYVIDMLVVLLIAQSISGIPVLNKQLNKYNKYYKEYVSYITDYTGFINDLNTIYKDKKVTDKEYERLVNDYPKYKAIVDKYYDDKKITSKELTNITNNIDKKYQKEYKSLYYKIDKNSIFYFIVYILTIFLYFVVFNKITDGRTLGKKILRIKIVNNEDSSSVSIWKYLLRSLFLYQFVFYIIRLICINILSKNDYYNIINLCNSLQYYLEIIIIMIMMIRTDGRGLHDLICNTKVISLDKKGNEIVDDSTIIKRKKLGKE